MKLATILALLWPAAAASASEPLRICLDADAPPYSSRHAGGKGFDVEVARSLARALDRPLTAVFFEGGRGEDGSAMVEADALLSDDRCDLVAGFPLVVDKLGKPGLSHARLPEYEGFDPNDRRRQVALGALIPTMPYHFASLTIVTGPRATKTIGGVGDLSELRIGVEGGTLSDLILMSYDKGRLIDHIQHYVPAIADFWTSFERDEFDAALVPLHRFDAYRAVHFDTKLKASGYVYPFGYNIGFVALAGREALVGDVNGALQNLLADGEIAADAAKAKMTFLAPRDPPISQPFRLPAGDP